MGGRDLREPGKEGGGRRLESGWWILSGTHVGR